MIDDKEIDAIEKRANAATKGPWTQTIAFISDGDGVHVATLNVPDIQFAQDNGSFIAHARQDIPALIAAVRELQAKNERLQAGFDDLIKAVETNGKLVGYHSDVLDRAHLARADAETGGGE